LQKLTTTVVIDAEEEDDHPRPVVAAIANVAAASLVDRASEEEPTISLDREGWMSSKWEKMRDLNLTVREPSPIYGGKIWNVVTEFIPPRFRHPAPPPMRAKGSPVNETHPYYFNPNIVK
jgi:hypothetical protein